MALLQVNEVEVEKKLGIVRKYRNETINIVLSVAVVYLFLSQKSLETEFRSYMSGQGADAVKSVNENTGVLKDIKTVLIENQNILKNQPK